MTPDRWQTIKELFNAALQRPPEERAGFLEQACGGDESVHREVDSLLAAHEKDESFLAVPAFEMGAELLMDSSSDPAAGEQIGPYKILSELGSGGMGDVYLAQDTRLGRNIALKLLPFEVARDRQRIRRFEQEARTASALNHPNVCVIHEIGATDDGRQFIAMEYIDGVTLRARMAQKRMTLAEALDVGAQIAWALEAAHAAGVVHRDIKPENIMLRRDGYVKVLDFGIAKLNEKPQPRALNEASTLAKVHTEPGTRMGTVKYMSPEQLRERPVDERTDIWSLGVVLHEMATGATPFEARTTNETIAAILERQPLSFTAYAADVPDGFQQVIKKALSKKRHDRFQKVAHLAAALREIRRQIEGRSPGELQTPGALRFDEAKLIPSPPHLVGERTAWRDRGNTVVTWTAEILSEIKEHKKAAMLALAATLLAMLFAGPYLTRLAVRLQGSAAPDPQIVASAKLGDVHLLTNSGTSVCAAISPDGKVVAHAEKKGDMQEVRYTSMATSATAVLIQPADVRYLGVTFSPDNNYLYLTRTEGHSFGVLYQVALPGNMLRKLKDGVDSPITFSPHGDQFSFVRFSEASGEFSLMIADADGGGERAVATRRGGSTLSLYGPAWSPDGQTIVSGTGWWDNGYHMNVIEFGVADGRERAVGAKQWYSVLQSGWLMDKSGLIISAKEQPLGPYQLWHISYPQGKVSKLTPGTTEYKSVSISRDGGSIIAVESHQDGKIWVGPSDSDEAHARVIVSTVGRTYGLNWIGKERLVFSSMAGSNLNISTVNVDSMDQAQLTVNSGDNYMPAVSPDGRLIIFASNRTGSLNIWRMNADDGSDLRQLTFSDGNAHPVCSSDGEWVVYDNQSNATFTLWKVPVEGGTPVQLTDKYAWMPLVSPDNQFIASRYYVDPDKRGIAILPFEGGPPVKMLPIPIMDWQQLTWSADGRALTFIRTDGGAGNVWSYDLNGGPAKKLTAFAADQIYGYAWSPDHAKLACARGAELRDVSIINNQN